MTTGSGAPIEARLVGPESLPEIERDWGELAARAIEPNPFLSPASGLARLRNLPDGRRARILVAWSGQGDGRRLVGLSLLVPPRGRHFNPLPILRAAELYAPLSMPLLAPEAPAETIEAMLGALQRAGIVALALPFLVEDGPVAAALREASSRKGLPATTLARHRRAFLRSPLPGSADSPAAPDQRRKKVDRQRRQLAKLGALSLTVARSQPDVSEALERFLVLEASGWKGAAGTAITHAEGARSYFGETVRDEAEAGAFRIVSLVLDGRTIAGTLVAIAGRRAFSVKTAYDESLSRFSPGLLLAFDLTAHLTDDPAIDDADSLAGADHPMIDRVWTERLPIAAMIIGTKPGGSAGFALAVAAERGREAAIALAKRLRARVASRAGRGAAGPADRHAAEGKDS